MEYIYAALLLHKLGKPVDEEGIKKIISVLGVEINEGKVKSIVASLKYVDIEAELANAIVASATGAPIAESAPIEEEHKEEKREAAAEGLSALFG